MVESRNRFSGCRSMSQNVIFERVNSEELQCHERRLSTINSQLSPSQPRRTPIECRRAGAQLLDTANVKLHRAIRAAGTAGAVEEPERIVPELLAVVDYALPE